MLGAIAPDMDYLYLYLFDPRNYDHHLYVTHFPLFWAVLLASSWLLLLANKTGGKALLFFIFALNGFIHMVLDTVTGHIFWLAPFSYRIFSGLWLMKEYAPGFESRFPNWHYALEALIILWSIILFLKSLRTSKSPSGNASSGTHPQS